MHASVNGTELYFDVEGAELAVGDGGLYRRPTLVVLHGGPGFDQGYLRPGLRSLAERGGPEAVAVAEQLFAGDFSAETLGAFQRLVAPHYAAPAHTDVPGRLMPLSTLNPEVAGHFFSELAARYDVRERLGEIAVPTLVIVGRYDWVCPPAASRAIAAAVADARLLELPDAGHFGFSETPEPFLNAVRAHLAITVAPIAGAAP